MREQFVPRQTFSYRQLAECDKFMMFHVDKTVKCRAECREDAVSRGRRQVCKQRPKVATDLLLLTACLPWTVAVDMFARVRTVNVPDSVVPVRGRWLLGLPPLYG